MSSTDRSLPRHLARLTSLRALAALLVFLFHLDLRGGTTGSAGGMLQFGYLGVGFFFLLSGFVLAWSWSPSTRRVSFYLRRFARIYPSHAVMLAVAALVPVTVVPVTAEHVVVTAALVQTWLPGVLEPYAANGVSWSLSCEAAFYLVLPVLLPVLCWMTGRLRWTIAIAYWCFATIFTFFVSFRAPYWQDAVYVFPPVRFAEFQLGVVAALAVRRGWRLSGARALVLVSLGTALAALGGTTFPAPGPGAALAVLALVMWAAQRDLEGRRGILTHPWLVYAGQVSFAFYLVHEIVLLNVSPWTGSPGLRANLLLFASACLAAVLLHHLVERPAERRLRQWDPSERPKSKVIATTSGTDGRRAPHE